MSDEIIWTITTTERVMALLVVSFALWIFLTLILMRNNHELKRRLKPVYYTDNPERDFERWDAEQERLLERMPVCDHCGERIQDEECWCIDVKFICKNCLADCMILTEDYADAELL